MERSVTLQRYSTVSTVYYSGTTRAGIVRILAQYSLLNWQMQYNTSMFLQHLSQEDIPTCKLLKDRCSYDSNEMLKCFCESVKNCVIQVSSTEDPVSVKASPSSPETVLYRLFFKVFDVKYSLIFTKPS